MDDAGAALRGNLPLQITSFVGRSREDATIRRLLATVRLVTLIGVGGVGKTRLALHAAQQIEGEFDDGVWLVDLSGLQDPDLVAQTVAMTLAVDDHAARTPVELLSAHLSHRRLLLILDNCEHLTDACADLVETLLARAAQLCVLATSRQPLGLLGEHTLVVSAMEGPDPTEISPDNAVDHSSDGSGRHDAVALFLDRAAAATGQFELTADNAREVATLCARLDGLPLAIELAAVQLRGLSVAQVLDRLDARFRLLATSRHSSHPRQDSLMAMVDWSFDLCTPEEQLLWARLPIFPATFDLESVEYVCADGRLAAERIVEVLRSLVNKSIVTRDEHGPAGRYRLLETLREYGRLHPPGYDDVWEAHRRHRDFYGELAQQSDTRWIRPAKDAWSARARAELPNIRAALTFCLDQPGEADTGLTMLASLWLYWRALGLISEGRAWFDRFLPVATAVTSARTMALWADAWLAALQGDTATTETLLAEAEALAQEVADGASGDHIASVRGLCALFDDDHARAVTLFESTLAGFRSRGDRVGTVLALHRLAQAQLAAGDPHRAQQLSSECIEECGDGRSWIAAHARWILGLATWQQGDPAAAVGFEHEVINVSSALGDRVGVTLGVQAIAWIAAASGQPERAARLLGAADRVRHETGSTFAERASMARFSLACTRAITASLSAVTYQEAFHAGAAMTDTEMIADALSTAPVPRATAGESWPPAGLTPREAEIADLVAQGMTNPEIARALVISARTAETHVQKILGKLGVRSRTQIATWVIERRGLGAAPGSSQPRQRRSRN